MNLAKIIDDYKKNIFPKYHSSVYVDTFYNKHIIMLVLYLSLWVLFGVVLNGVSKLFFLVWFFFVFAVLFVGKLFKRHFEKNSKGNLLYDLNGLCKDNNISKKQIEILIEIFKNRIAESKFSFKEIFVSLLGVVLTSVIFPFAMSWLENFRLNDIIRFNILIITCVVFIYISYVISNLFYEWRTRDNRVLSCFIEDLYLIKSEEQRDEYTKDCLGAELSDYGCNKGIQSAILNDFVKMIDYTYFDHINQNPVKKDIEYKTNQWNPSVTDNNSGNTSGRENDYSSFVGNNVAPDKKNIEGLANSIMPYLLKEKNIKIDFEKKKEKYKTIKNVSLCVAASVVCCCIILCKLF